MGAESTVVDKVSPVMRSVSALLSSPTADIPKPRDGAGRFSPETPAATETPPATTPAGETPPAPATPAGESVQPAAESTTEPAAVVPPAPTPPEGAEARGEASPESAATPQAQEGEEDEEASPAEMEALRRAVEENPEMAEAYGRAVLGLPPKPKGAPAGTAPLSTYVPASKDAAFKEKLQALRDDGKDAEADILLGERMEADAQARVTEREQKIAAETKAKERKTAVETYRKKQMSTLLGLRKADPKFQADVEPHIQAVLKEYANVIGQEAATLLPIQDLADLGRLRHARAMQAQKAAATKAAAQSRGMAAGAGLPSTPARAAAPAPKPAVVPANADLERFVGHIGNGRKRLIP